MRFRLWGAAALAAAVGAPWAVPGTARAQDAVLAIKSVDEVFDDLEYLIKAVVPEEMAEQVLPALEGFRGPEALAGLDRKRPIGVFATLPAQPGAAPVVAGAIPITSLDDLLATLQNFGIVAEPAQGVAGFTHQIGLPIGDVTLFLTASDDYAYLTPIPADAGRLKALKVADWYPKRPGLGDISLAVRIDRLPQELKDQALAQIEQGMQSERERKPDESELDYRGRQAGIDLVSNAFTRLVRDGGTLAVDLTIDAKAGQVSLETSLSGRAGTPLAGELNEFARLRSRFAGLAPQAPVAAWMALPIPEEFRDLLIAAFEKGLEENPPEGAEARKLAEEFVEVMKASLRQDVQDVGLAVQGPSERARSDKYALAMALKVVEGKRIEDLVKRAVALDAPEEGTEVAIDAAKAADGTPIHRIKGPIDADTAKAFGDAALYLAFRDDALVAGFGERGQRALERALAVASGAPGTQGDSDAPIALTFRVSKLTAMAEDQKEQAEQAAAEVFRGPDAEKDVVRLSVRGEGGALLVRFAVDVPALKFLSLVGQAAQSGLQLR